MIKAWDMMVNFKQIKLGKVLRPKKLSVNELIVNAYHADATRVKITIDRSRNTLDIEDNGKGMEEKDIRNFLSSGERAEENKISEFGRKSPDALGLKGILALANLAKKCTINTIKNSKKYKCDLSRDFLDGNSTKIKVEIQRCKKNLHETTLRLENLKWKINQNELCKGLKRLSDLPFFRIELLDRSLSGQPKIFVSGKQVTDFEIDVHKFISQCDEKLLKKKIENIGKISKVCDELVIDHPSACKFADLLNVCFDKNFIWKRKRYVRQYVKLYNQLGHPPKNDAVAFNDIKWRGLWMDIIDYYGSIYNFRKQCNLMRLKPKKLVTEKKRPIKKIRLKRRQRRRI